MSLQGKRERWIGLNVGGKVFVTSRDTLTRDPDSMLCCMLSQYDSTQGLPAASKDKDGNLVIDRDGDTFKYILNFLRDGSCVYPLDVGTRAELLREANYFQVCVCQTQAQVFPISAAKYGLSSNGFWLQIAELSRQLRRNTSDLSSTTSSEAAALLVPDASSQKHMVLESLRSQAGTQNIAAAERALLDMAFGTDDESVMDRAALAANFRNSNCGVLTCSPFNEETKVLAMEANYRVIALSLAPTGDITNYPLLEEDYLAHGAHCTGSDFAQFVWKYQQVLQHDLSLLDYTVIIEKGTRTFEESNSGVFWVTILCPDSLPPSSNHKSTSRRPT